MKITRRQLKKVIYEVLTGARSVIQESTSPQDLSADEVQFGVEAGMFIIDPSVDISNGLTGKQQEDLFAQGKLTIDPEKMSSTVRDIADKSQERTEEKIRSQGKKDGKAEEEIEQEIQDFRDEMDAASQKVDDEFADILDGDPEPEKERSKPQRRVSKYNPKDPKARYAVSVQALTKSRGEAQHGYDDSSSFEVTDMKTGKEFDFSAGDIPLRLPGTDLEIVDVRERDPSLFGSSNLEAVYLVGPPELRNKEFMLQMKSLSESTLTRSEIRRLILEELSLMHRCQPLVESLERPARGSLQICGNLVSVEIADTPALRNRGLMFRGDLGLREGMLFVFPRSEQLSFWMKDTYIPLSIAFINESGVVVNISNMTPGSLQNTLSVEPAVYALEMKQGEFEKIGLTAGKRISGLPSIALL